MELQATRFPVESLNEKDVDVAADMHGAFAAVLAVFRISLVIRSIPILPLWVMPSLVVASNHPFTPCKNGMAIIAATIPSRVITIIISMRVKPLLLFMGELPLPIYPFLIHSPSGRGPGSGWGSEFTRNSNQI